MKPIPCILLVFAAFGTLSARAEPVSEPEPSDRPDVLVTNAEASAPPPAGPETLSQADPADGSDAPEAVDVFETHIYSDSVELGVKSRSAVYRGDVRLVDPRLHLTCEQLSADVPEDGSRVEHVVAETNVVIVAIDDEGKTNRAYADKAVYTYRVTETGTNEVVELSGQTQPRIETDEIILYGDTIVWDRVSDTIRATNERMFYRGDPSPSGPAASPGATNPPAADLSSTGSVPASAISAGNTGGEGTDE